MAESPAGVRATRQGVHGKVARARGEDPDLAGAQGVPGERAGHAGERAHAVGPRRAVHPSTPALSPDVSRTRFFATQRQLARGCAHGLVLRHVAVPARG